MPTIETREASEPAETAEFTAPEPAMDPDVAEVLEAPLVKRGPGRPRTRPVELPNPRRFPLRPEEFFKFWHQCEQIDPDRLIVYVWRTFPIIDKKMLDPDAPTNIGKMEKAPEPDGWRLALLQRFGSGNYKLMLKDEGLKKPKAIAQTFITDLHDPDYPPWLESLDELVISHPSNQAFIEGLKQKGIWPGEREMAGSEAMSILAGTVKDLSAQAAAQKKEPPAQQQSVPEVITQTLAMADKAFDRGAALTEKAMEAKVEAAKASASMGQQNPGQAIDFFEKVASVIQKLQPAAPANATAPVTAAPNLGEMVTQLTGIFTLFADREQKLQGTIMALQANRLEALEKRLQELIANPTAAAVPKDDLATGLDKLLALKDKILALSGPKDEETEVREPKLPPWMHLAQTALNVLPNTAASMVAMSHNLAVARTGQGEPIAAGSIETEPPALPPATNPNPTPGEAPMRLDAVTLGFLRAIERPLINHLNDSTKTGEDFAFWVKDGYGDIGYQAAREKGKDGLMKMLMSYRPIVEVIQQIPERSLQFIDEFLTAEEPPVEEHGRSFVAPAEGAAQVVDVPPVVLAQEAARKKRAKAGV